MVELSFLKKYGVTGKIGFSISAEDSEENQDLYNTFFLFAKQETNNDFTSALRLLMKNISTDYKYEGLNCRLQDLELRLSELENKPVEKKEKESNIF